MNLAKLVAATLRRPVTAPDSVGKTRFNSNRLTSPARITRLSIALLVGILLTTFQTPALADWISFTGEAYEEDFDSLFKSSGEVTKSNVGPHNLDTSIHANFKDVTLTGWQGWKYENGGNNNQDFNFRISSGQGTGSGIYSYGTSGSEDRALGALASVNTGNYRFGVILQNDTGVTIDHFHLQFFGEQWRKIAASTNKQLTFDFAIGDGLDSIYSTPSQDTSLYKSVPELTFNRLISGWPTESVNGNSNRIEINHLVENIDWQPGQNLVLRWTDVMITGDNPALAIDDLTFSVDLVHAPEPPAIGLLGLAALGLGVRWRRRSVVG